MSVHRKIIGFKPQGTNEAQTYALDISTWPSSPSTADDVTFTVYLNGSDVTDTVISGAVSYSSDIITFPQILNLTAGNKYLVSVLWEGADGDTYEAYGYLIGDDNG